MSSDSPSPNPVHFMIDIETLDTWPSAVILSIGVCIVTAHTNPADLDTFYIELDVSTQFDRTRSRDTVNWWAVQKFSPPMGTVYIEGALDLLEKFLLRHTVRPIIWCKGTDFDTAILADAYKSFGLPTPWKYNDVRDWRTVKKMFGDGLVTTIENPTPHHALADAVFQAQQLQALGFPLK